MVCGSPSRGLSLIPCLALVLTVITQFHPVGSYHGNTNDSGVYYEQYPFQHFNLKNEQPLSNQSKSDSEEVEKNNWNEDGFSVNCTEPTIQDFPNDMFTQEQRRKGKVVLEEVVQVMEFIYIL